MGLVNLHRHTAFSLYDGMGTPAQGATFAKSMGQTALGISDHGVMDGVMEHYTACKAVGIKPILGVEGYMLPKIDTENMIRAYFHISLFATSMIGYSNLCQLVTASNQQGYYYYKPKMDFELLERYAEGIICLSGCPAALLPRLILEGREESAHKVIKKFLSIFGKNFYFEVQPNLFDEAITINTHIIELSKKYRIPAVMTIDSHYPSREEKDTFDVIHEPEDMMANYSTLFMQSEREALIFWKHGMGTDGTEYIENTQLVASQCDIEFQFQESVPDMSEPGVTSEQLLVQKAKSKLEPRGKWTQEYKLRLRHELETIIPRGFTNYFLLCADLISYAKSKDIAVGIGRGSSGGSLVAYALDITDVDPILLNIEFERFLNPEREDQPDIDMDFCSIRRDEVIAYALQKFQGRAAQLGNVNRWKTDSTLNDLGKRLRVPLDVIASLKYQLQAISYDEHPQAFDDLMKYPDLKKANMQYENIILHFCRLHGQAKAIGKHAAGVAIMKEDISKYVPLVWIANTKTFQTAYDKHSVGPLGILKIDMLGLNTATILHEMEKSTGVTIDRIPLDDPDVYAAFQAADTDGIFQQETPGAKGILRELQPQDIQDLMVSIALNRPGASQQGSLKKYVLGKHGKIDTHDPVTPYTKDTYGAMIYHENVMRLCRDYGLDWTTTYKIIKKINTPVVDGSPLQTAFVEAAMNNKHMSEKDAKDLYYRITRYSFNKGHSGSYALMGYYMMWFKVHHTTIFYCTSLKYCEAETKRIELHMRCVKRGIPILLPHVNGGAYYKIVTFEGEQAIQIGMSSLKGVRNIGKVIEQNGPYTSKEEVERKVKVAQNRKLPSNVVTALEEHGALEFDPKVFRSMCIRYCAKLYGRKGAA